MSLDNSYYVQGKSIITSSYADLRKSKPKKSSAKKASKLTLVKDNPHTKSETLILKPYSINRAKGVDNDSEGDIEEGTSAMMTPFIASMPKTISM